MKKRVGFTDRDAAHIARLAPHVDAIVPRVVGRFYDQLLADPESAAIFTGGEAQLARQRALLSTWLSRILVGRFEMEHFEASLRIGEAHVRAGLDQHYMVLGIQIIWGELAPLLQTLPLDEGEAIATALHKLLMLDLATMLESYKEGYSDEVRSKERIAVEEKLTRAEHLAEIGQLAASLAHEIKNPLAGISGAIQIMRDSMSADDPHRPIAKEMMEQIKRLDATVKDLLQYARPIPPRFGRVDLDEIVSHVLNALSLE
ncbi:MAG: protoglobin domain-containing protein, partial [Candidatus Binatia bacterium]